MNQTFLVVFRFQGVIPNIPERRHADVGDGNPAFDLVVIGPMHPVGQPHGRRGGRSLQAGESGGVIHHVIGKQDFFAPARHEIPRGRVVKPAKDGDPGKQQNIRAIPEAMNRHARFRRFWQGFWRDRLALGGGLLRGSGRQETAQRYGQHRKNRKA